MLFPDRIVVPVPICWNAPLPEIKPPKVNVSEWLIAKLALSITLPMIEPLVPPLPSCKVPPLIVQGVAVVPVPIKLQVLLPAFAKMPKPWYWEPICETSKVALLAPPSRKISAVLNATTLPLMAEPARSSRVLVPPVKVMALARVVPSPESPPLMLPLLMTVRPVPTMPAPPAPIEPKTPPEPPLPPATAPELVIVAPPAVNCMPAPPEPPPAPTPRPKLAAAPPWPPVTEPELANAAPVVATCTHRRRRQRCRRRDR